MLYITKFWSKQQKDNFIHGEVEKPYLNTGDQSVRLDVLSFLEFIAKAQFVVHVVSLFEKLEKS